ncbi:MAG: peptidoglycan-binding domain-containing protein [Minisyncoccia bacterium]
MMITFNNIVPVVNNVSTNKPEIPVFIFSKSNKVGKRNNEVLQLQKFLNSKGYIISTKGAGSIGKETNYFGVATKKALIKFQKANKLKADGTMNPKTINLINKLSKLNK